MLSTLCLLLLHSVPQLIPNHGPKIYKGSITGRWFSGTSINVHCRYTTNEEVCPHLWLGLCVFEMSRFRMPYKILSFYLVSRETHSQASTGSLTRGNPELWEDQVPTPRRRDTKCCNTNIPALRKERALFGSLSDRQAPRPVCHLLLSEGYDPTLVQSSSYLRWGHSARHHELPGGLDT